MLSDWPAARFYRVLRNEGTLANLRQAASNALDP